MILRIKALLKKLPHLLIFFSQKKKRNWRRKIERKQETLGYRLARKSILSTKDGNTLIIRLLQSNQPLAIGKIGNVELNAILNFSTKKNRKGKIYWREKLSKRLFYNAGVFPPQDEILNRFSTEFLAALGYIDLLAVWYKTGECNIVTKYLSEATLVELSAFDFFKHKRPWTQLLKNRKVLVIHPFVETIKKQYARREKLWPYNPDILPLFNLQTLKVPLSNALVNSAFQDWFEAFDFLKRKIDQIDFDIAIVGAGAWSIPLVVYAKKIGKVGIHLGGATQLLFGIKGGRWDNSLIAKQFYNDSWVRPSPVETPKNASAIEKGCYW
jgi:hypothetical protein